MGRIYFEVGAQAEAFGRLLGAVRETLAHNASEVRGYSGLQDALDDFDAADEIKPSPGERVLDVARRLAVYELTDERPRALVGELRRALEHSEGDPR